MVKIEKRHVILNPFGTFVSYSTFTVCQSLRNILFRYLRMLLIGYKVQDHDDFMGGLEIPMDDLSDLNMMV